MSRDYGRVDVDIVAHVRADYDLPDLIRRHRKEYAALPVKTLGYQEWERPSVFLNDHIMDRIDVGELDVDRIDIAWTEDDFRALCLVLPTGPRTRSLVA